MMVVTLRELQNLLSKGCIRGVTINVNFVIDYAKKNSISKYFDAIIPSYEVAKGISADFPFSIQAVSKTR